jgi:phosphoribosylformylglycinamidine cyclo-ligase
MGSTSYSDAGVNIDLGDKASKILYEVSKKSWINRKGLIGEVIAPFDDFSGIRAIDVSLLPKGTFMGIGFDGVGTKIEIAERLGKFDSIGFDLLSMVCDDAVVRGAEPVIAGSILDVNTLGYGENNFIANIESLAKGYLAAANEANVALVNGELAELGSSISGYGEFNFSWGASVVWFGSKDKMFTGKEINIGDSIISLEEPGFRSNGLSLVRKIFKDNYGELWHEAKFLNSIIGELVLTPSKIYSKHVSKIFGGFREAKLIDMSGVCHVTGGGIPGKLGRILKVSKLGASLLDLNEVPEIVKHAQALGNVTDREAYKTWCMGQGMLLVSRNPDELLEFFSKTELKARVVGEVIRDPEIIISSKGFSSPGEKIVYKL